MDSQSILSKICTASVAQRKGILLVHVRNSNIFVMLLLSKVIIYGFAAPCTQHKGGGGWWWEWFLPRLLWSLFFVLIYLQSRSGVL